MKNILLLTADSNLATLNLTHREKSNFFYMFLCIFGKEVFMRHLLFSFILVILDVVLLHILDMHKDHPVVGKIHRVINILGKVIFVLLSILMIVLMLKYL